MTCLIKKCSKFTLKLKLLKIVLLLLLFFHYNFLQTFHQGNFVSNENPIILVFKIILSERYVSTHWKNFMRERVQKSTTVWTRIPRSTDKVIVSRKQLRCSDSNFYIRGTARTQSQLPKIMHPKQPRFADVANVNPSVCNERSLLGGASLLIKACPSAR